MPIYNYQCKKCGYEFEKMLSISNLNEPISDPCPNEECGTLGEVVKVIVGKFKSVEKIGKPPEDFNYMLKRIKKGTKDAADFKTY